MRRLCILALGILIGGRSLAALPGAATLSLPQSDSFGYTANSAPFLWTDIRRHWHPDQQPAT